MMQFKPPVNKVIILAGKRWLVEGLDDSTSKVYVSCVKYGGMAMFGGNGIEVDRIVVEKMREIYQADTIYPYLDKCTEANKYLEQGRIFFQYNNIENTSFLQYGNENYIFTWAGTKINRTIALFAQYYLNKQCDYGSFYVSNLILDDVKLLKQKVKIKTDIVEMVSILPRQCKMFQKYDNLLSDRLLDIEYSCTYLDVDLARDILLGICVK